MRRLAGMMALVGCSFRGPVSDNANPDSASPADGSPAQSRDATSGLPPCTPGGPDHAHWSLDEGVGGQATDDSGEHVATLGDDATWAPGHSGSALTFDGADDVALATTPSPLDNLTDLSFTAWIDPTSSGTGGYGVIVAKGGAGAGASKRFLLNRHIGGSCPGCLELAVSRSNQYDQAVSSQGAIAFTGWQFVAATYTVAAGPRIYVDGLDVTNTTTTDSGSLQADDATGHAIGNYPTASSNGDFVGRIDNVRIYCRALGPDEIAELHASTR